MLKVLYICDADQLYGSPTVLVQLLREFKSKGLLSAIVLTSEYGPLNKKLDSMDIENYAVGQVGFFIGTNRKWKKVIKTCAVPLYKLKFDKQLEKAMILADKYINFSDIDVIHTNVSINRLGAELSEKYHIPHIWHLRETFTTGNLFFAIPKDYISYMNNHAQKFIAISNFVSKSWDNLGLNNSKISVVPDGILPQKENNHVRPISNKVRIVQVGSISDFKGQIRLVKAIAKLPKYIRDDVEVDFIGDGSLKYMKYIKRVVSQLNVQKQINFLGYVDNAHEKIGQYDIGIVSSPEGFGLVTVEYMLSKLAVIAEDSGANGEIIKDGYNGKLYQQNNIDELAQNIEDIILNKSYRKHLADQAFRDAIEKYHIKKSAEKLMDIYEHLSYNH